MLGNLVVVSSLMLHHFRGFRRRPNSAHNPGHDQPRPLPGLATPATVNFMVEDGVVSLCCYGVKIEGFLFSIYNGGCLSPTALLLIQITHRTYTF